MNLSHPATSCSTPRPVDPAGAVENARSAFPTAPWTAHTTRRPQAPQALPLTLSQSTTAKEGKQPEPNTGTALSSTEGGIINFRIGGKLGVLLTTGDEDSSEPHEMAPEHSATWPLWGAHLCGPRRIVGRNCRRPPTSRTPALGCGPGARPSLPEKLPSRSGASTAHSRTLQSAPSSPAVDASSVDVPHLSVCHSEIHPVQGAAHPLNTHPCNPDLPTAGSTQTESPVG